MLKDGLSSRAGVDVTRVLAGGVVVMLDLVLHSSQSETDTASHLSLVLVLGDGAAVGLEDSGSSHAVGGFTCGEVLDSGVLLAALFHVGSKSEGNTASTVSLLLAASSTALGTSELGHGVLATVF